MFSILRHKGKLVALSLQEVKIAALQRPTYPHMDGGGCRWSALSIYETTLDKNVPVLLKPDVRRKCQKLNLEVKH